DEDGEQKRGEPSRSLGVRPDTEYERNNSTDEGDYGAPCVLPEQLEEIPKIDEEVLHCYECYRNQFPEGMIVVGQYRGNAPWESWDLWELWDRRISKLQTQNGVIRSASLPLRFQNDLIPVVTTTRVAGCWMPIAPAVIKTASVA